jgi:membrane-associated phospholipid phosphatase
VLGACIVLCIVRRLWLEAALFTGAGMFAAVQYTMRESIHRPFPGFDNSPDPVEVFPVGDSFPSGHVFGEVIVYGLIFVLADRLFPWWPLAWTARVACVAIIVTGMPARLATGSHWPSDVIGSVLLAFIYLIPALWLYAWARSRGDEARASNRVSYATTA